MGKKKLGKAKKGSPKASSAVTRGLKKALAAWKKAQAQVAKTTDRINEAIRTLITADAGSSKERTAEKVTRRVVKELLAAKKKLRKAIRKRKKAATKGRRAKDGGKDGRAPAHARPKAATNVPRRRAQRARESATVAQKTGAPGIAPASAAKSVDSATRPVSTVEP